MMFLVIFCINGPQPSCFTNHSEDLDIVIPFVILGIRHCKPILIEIKAVIMADS